MLRSHSLVAVGQQHHESALPRPLVLTTADELVNDALRGEGRGGEERIVWCSQCHNVEHEQFTKSISRGVEWRKFQLRSTFQ